MAFNTKNVFESVNFVENDSHVKMHWYKYEPLMYMLVLVPFVCLLWHANAYHAMRDKHGKLGLQWSSFSPSNEIGHRNSQN